MRLALVSCANLPFGFFNVYARIAARPDLDAVLHLGDYIYEYANNDYGNRPEGDGRPLGRVPFPDREIVTLDDYRARYAQYREDPDLQAAHRQHPFIVVWDDHETANNAWSGGAENHNAGRRRRGRRGEAAAFRAWREWMPVREAPGAEFRMYRQFAFGDLADLMMLDTRIEGRDQQVRARGRRRSSSAASRQLLGAAQEEWLCGQPARFDRCRQAVADPRPAGDVRAADAARQAGRQQRLVGRLSRARGRACSTWPQRAEREAPGRAHRRRAQRVGLRPRARPVRPSRRTTRGPGRGAIGTEIVAPAVTSPGRPGAGRMCRRSSPRVRTSSTSSGSSAATSSWT